MVTIKSGNYEGNVPARFQRFRNLVLRTLSNQICLIYLDDILEFSPIWSNHIANMDKALTCLREAGQKNASLSGKK